MSETMLVGIGTGIVREKWARRASGHVGFLFGECGPGIDMRPKLAARVTEAGSADNFRRRCDPGFICGSAGGIIVA